jgi:hypothetical protein
LVQTCQSTDDKGIRQALLEAIFNLMKGVKDSKRDFVDSSKMTLEKLLLVLIANVEEGEGDLLTFNDKIRFENMLQSVLQYIFLLLLPQRLKKCFRKN